MTGHDSTGCTRAARPLANERSLALAVRARRVIWKGGKEATQHDALRACGFPRFLNSGTGCRIRDVDGNCYVDYLMSWGTVLLGHACPAVESAVRRQMERGSHLNLAIEEEVSLAERLVARTPGSGLARFLASGSEATTAAVRVARAATGRPHVVHYGFHGWLDWSQAEHPSGILPDTLSHTLSFEYNDLESLEQVFERNPKTIACVIMEPVTVDPPDEGFLAGVRDLTRRHGALLVFDEAKTGFRFGAGGAQAYFGVTPDLSVFSKALANGYPIAAVIGRTDVFESASDAWISGTYHGWPLAIAAAHATLDVLEHEPVVDAVWALGSRLMTGVNALMECHGLAARLAGMPPMPRLRHPPEESLTMRRLFAELLVRGYFIHPIRPWFISYAHDARIVDETIAAVDAALRQAVDA